MSAEAVGVDNVYRSPEGPVRQIAEKAGHDGGVDDRRVFRKLPSPAMEGLNEHLKGMAEGLVGERVTIFWPPVVRARIPLRAVA